MNSPETIKPLIEGIRKKHEELESLPISADSFAPWAFSKYKMLKKCPFQFYLKYILKIKVPPTLLAQDDPVSTNVGKAAHEILDGVVLGKDLDKTYEAVKQSYIQDKLLTEENWEERVEVLRYNITKFKERIDDFQRRHPIKRIFTELRIGLDKNFDPEGFFDDNVWLRGVIDLIAILECEDALILDHKTGGFAAGGTKNYEEQLDWYKALVHFGIAKLEGAQSGVHFIAEGDIKLANYSNKEDIENKIKNTIFLSIDGAIELLLNTGYFKHIRGSHCKWCEFDALGCKSGELLPIEKETKKWFPIKEIT